MMAGLGELLEELLEDGQRRRHGHDRYHDPCSDDPGYRPTRVDRAARQCAACALPVPRGARFCPGCGTSQEPGEAGWSCFLCGHALPPGARFCPGCGDAVK